MKNWLVLWKLKYSLSVAQVFNTRELPMHVEYISSHLYIQSRIMYIEVFREQRTAFPCTYPGLITFLGNRNHMLNVGIMSAHKGKGNK